MATVSVRLNQEEETFFKSYAALSGKSLSTLLKEALAQSIEDEYDLNIYKKAFEEYQQDSETISHVDFKKELGF
ncbi:DUF6290 family protein [Streptococcus sp. SPS1]|uniref:type II toxin-antitoxin system RelB family antitoxin n=1 Tax=Streptococcus sp. SPS1 TaxID=3018247 RepID=UPI001192A024|nr:DUF6290 family protein [Streptococcus sp. SPS1]MDN5027590.1 DUF6290 family protein [Streptococcus sp. SPS1]TVV53472.1 translation repressor RelB [Streptococcus pneumoniae]